MTPRGFAATLTLAAICACTPVQAKDDPSPADYPLQVNVTAFAEQIHMEYRGTDCTSTGSGEIQAIDTGTTINGTVSTVSYTTCDPNWAAHHAAVAEAKIGTQVYLLECTDVGKRARWTSFAGRLAIAGSAGAARTPSQEAEANQQARRVQPLPPSENCALTPGSYSGQWSGGRLVFLLPRSNSKYTTVNYRVIDAVAPQSTVAPVKQSETQSQKQSEIAKPSSAKLNIASKPDGADIEVDGTFVGNTPSSLELPSGEHTVSVSKSGYKPWERKIKLTSGEVRLNAELEKN